MRIAKQEGFTLVETMIALALLAFGILAVAPMFIFAARANEVGSDFGTLGAAAVDRMERLRELEFSDPHLASGGSLVEDVMTGIAYFDNSNPAAIVRWEISDNIDPPWTKTVRVRTISRRVTIGHPKEVVIAVVRGR